jgi:hypothetical protein
MTSIHEICSAISHESIDGFELSNRLESRFSSAKPSPDELADVLKAVSNRCKVDPGFRQDLIDFDVIAPLLKRSPAVHLNLIPSLVGFLRDMKVIMNEAGITDNMVKDLCSFLDTPQGSIDPNLAHAICSINEACNENKLKFIQKSGLMERIVDRLSTETDGSLLRVLRSVLSDDDREGRIPAPVFARENLLDEKHIESVRKMLRLHADSPSGDIATLFDVVREFSASQMHSTLLALEDGFLEKALRSTGERHKEIQHPIIKYLRQLSFADDMKVPVLESLISRGSYINECIELAKTDRVISAHLFGILANLCLKSPDSCRTLLNHFPKIGGLASVVLTKTVTSDNETIQCLQFLRCLTKSDEGKLFLQSQYESDIALSAARSTDKTVNRIAREIMMKIDGS